MSEQPDRPDPASVVADADVLSADLLVGGDARTAVDRVREHSWIDLLASDALLIDAETTVERLANADLATAWRERIERERVRVDHPPGDHPALASAYRGGAAHVLSFDERLRSAETGAWLGSRARVSVKTPAGFLRQFDPASLYRAVHDETYPGPDRDPRA